jgi:hypothetical protein
MPTFVQLGLQSCDFALHSANPIHALALYAMLFDRFATFGHERWNLHFVSGHLFSQIYTKGGSAFVNSTV